MQSFIYIHDKCPSCFYKNLDKFYLDFTLYKNLEQAKGNYYN